MKCKSSGLCRNMKGKRMEKIKEFVKDHKKEIAIGVGVFLIYRIGYSRGYSSYKKVVVNTFDTMKKDGFNVVQLIPPTNI